MHIYPAIDMLRGRCVRLVQGDYERETSYSDAPELVAERWVKEGADRLHLVDLDGAKEGKPINGEVVRKIIKASGVPCQFGGGIRSEADLESVFGWGVHWAVLGTKALQDPEWVRRQAERYPDRIVLGLDARNGYVATEGWLADSTTRAVDLARLIAGAPIAAIVYTDIARDGMLTGPNYEALDELRAATEYPVIASGGVGSVEQVSRLAKSGVYGCIIGKALYEGRIRLSEVLNSERGASPPVSIHRRSG